MNGSRFSSSSTGIEDVFADGWRGLSNIDTCTLCLLFIVVYIRTATRVSIRIRLGLGLRHSLRICIRTSMCIIFILVY